MMLDELYDTLQFCRDALPPDTHEVHVARLGLIRKMLKWAYSQDEAHWERALKQVERMADIKVGKVQV